MDAFWGVISPGSGNFGACVRMFFETQAYTTLLPLADPTQVLLIYNSGSPGCFNDRSPAGKPVLLLDAMWIEVVIEEADV